MKVFLLVIALIAFAAVEASADEVRDNCDWNAVDMMNAITVMNRTVQRDFGNQYGTDDKNVCKGSIKELVLYSTKFNLNGKDVSVLKTSVHNRVSECKRNLDKMSAELNQINFKSTTNLTTPEALKVKLDAIISNEIKLADFTKDSDYEDLVPMREGTKIGLGDGDGVESCQENEGGSYSADLISSLRLLNGATFGKFEYNCEPLVETLLKVLNYVDTLEKLKKFMAQVEKDTNQLVVSAHGFDETTVDAYVNFTQKIVNHLNPLQVSLADHEARRFSYRIYKTARLILKKNFSKAKQAISILELEDKNALKSVLKEFLDCGNYENLQKFVEFYDATRLNIIEELKTECDATEREERVTCITYTFGCFCH
jgi:hypothetical protein